MVEAKVISIFRLIAPTDTPTTDKIDFNIVSQKDTKAENAFITGIVKTETEGEGNNLAIEKEDSNVQALGVIEGAWQVTGFISNMHGNSDDGNNAFVQKLTEWKDGPQQNGTWPGTFGIIDNNDTTNTLVPVSTPISDAVGLIFRSFEKTNNYPLNRVEFVLKFRRARGLDV